MKTYSDQPHPGVSFPKGSQPRIQGKHIDGPLLTFSDGQMHWLTPWERVQVRFRWTDAKQLQRKHRPNLTAILEIEHIGTYR